MKKKLLKQQKNNRRLIVVCHNIRSAYNIGSIFRTADAAGVSRIILGGYSAHPPNPKISKTALGAENNVPYERVWHTHKIIETLKKEGFLIAALETPSLHPPPFKGGGMGGGSPMPQNIFNFKPKFPLALILGNEVRGLSKEILARCDKIIYIPMLGKKESLNVSVAFGVAAYQLRISPLLS